MAVARLAGTDILTHVIDNRHEDVAVRIRDITRKGVDNVLEITGSPEMARIGMDLLNPQGCLALLTGGQAVGFLPGGRRVHAVIQGDAMPQRFIPKLIGLYRAGRFPFDRLVKFYKFGDINRAIRDANRGVTIKPVLRIGMEQEPS